MNMLTEIVICLHVISILKAMYDSLHPVEYTHVSHDAAISIWPRECALTHSQVFKAETLLVCGEVEELA